MKKIIIFGLFIISLNSCAQKKIEEVITDANGKQIKTENKDINSNNLEETIEEFYKNIDDASKLDNLMSFRYYQNIPYNKFKELTLKKAEQFGKLKNKKIIGKEFSPDKKAVKYYIEAEYEKANSNEAIILMKENEKDNFKILEYIYESK